MLCSECQTENRAGQDFCSQCGASLGVTCGACGSINAAADRFCGRCGSRLRSSASAARAFGERAPDPPRELAEKAFLAMIFALALGSAGNVRTTTLKAFTKEEFAEIVKKLP